MSLRVLSRTLVLFAATAAMFAACSESSAPGTGDAGDGRPRLVLLYANCSLNRAGISPYDPGVPYTPHLGALAREGLVFGEHHTETGVSGPSFAALLSGTQAPRHKVYWHPRRLPRELTLLPEAFGAAGYEPFFWSGHPMAAARRGYGQGIPKRNVVLSDAPEHRLVTDRADLPDRTQLTANDARFEAILDRLRDDRDYRAYVQVFFTVTHAPYHNLFTDEEFAAFRRDYPDVCGDVTQADLDRWFPVYDEHRFGLQWNFPETVARLGLGAAEVERLAAVLELAYRVSVHKLDRAVGDVLAKIRARGLDDETLVAFTTDHGELLYRENALFQWTHGNQLAPEVLRIPLIVRGPGVPAGRYAAVTRSVDVHPTLLGLCGIAPQADLDGVDLSRAVRGEAEPPELRALCHTTLISEHQYRKVPGMTLRTTYFPRMDPATMWVLIREGAMAYKLRSTDVGGWRFEAFDWTRDPGETRDLFDAADPVHARMADDLTAYKALLVGAYPGADDADEGDEEASQALDDLRSLGYVR